MDLAVLKRFGPLLPLLSRPGGSLSTDEMSMVATSLGGEGALNGFLPFLVSLTNKAPNTPISEILGSPEATKMLEQVRDGGKAAGEQDTIMVACAYCGAHYESALSA